MQYIYYGLPVLGIGYFTYNYGKNMLANYVLSQVQTELKTRMDTETLEDVYRVSENGKSVRIKYKTAGKWFETYLPYKRNLLNKMCQGKFYLVKNGQHISLNLKPGIPLTVSASDMGGESIIYENLDGEKTEFLENEIPQI